MVARIFITISTHIQSYFQLQSVQNMNPFTQMLVLVISSILQAIDDGSVKLPQDDYLTNDCKLSYVLLGDDAFAVKEFMMKPYLQQNLTADKHSRARRISKNFFDILANRWRIYFKIIKVNESRYSRCGVNPHFPKTKKQLPKFW